MTGSSSTNLEVGRRYINTKTRQPLTLLYIGPLPPNDTGETSGPSASSIWLGVEYDDPTHGKGHSGIYNNTQIFNTRQEGAGAFIKYKTGTELQEGKTFVQAINERYALGGGMESVILGSSNAVVVEAPGMDGVSKRLRTLERSRQIGLEDELICWVGGSEEERADLGSRLKGLFVIWSGGRADDRCEDVEYIEESGQYMGGSRGDFESRGRGHYAHHEVSCWVINSLLPTSRIRSKTGDPPPLLQGESAKFDPTDPLSCLIYFSASYWKQSEAPVYELRISLTI
jgi:hypothetical protein